MALLPPLASAAELALITGRSASDQRLVAALREASRRFRGQVHHAVSLVEEETIELGGSGSSVLLLPALPVLAIQSCILEGTTLVEGDDFRLSKRRGYLERVGRATWGRSPDGVEVTYSHGYDATPTAELDATADLPAGSLPGVPEEIQAAILNLAQVLLTVTPGVQARTVLGDSITFGAAASVGATQEWIDAVENYKISLGS